MSESERAGPTGPAEPARRRRGGVGRGEKVRSAVLAATLAELAETGYAALTVEAVARRAGVHKTTVYRRWTDRETLVVEALDEHIAQESPVPDTGALAGDLRALARGFVRWATGAAGQAQIAALLTGGARIPELATARRRVFAGRLQRATPVVVRAVERGEVPAGTQPAELLRHLVAPLYLRLLVTDEAVTERAADAAARVTFVAAAAGAFVAGG